MADLPFPLSGTTLVVGPSNAGKTRLTARALDAWVAARGTEGVVVFDFAPVVERDGRVLGGRLTRFTTPPDGAWYGVLDAHASRADSDDETGATRLAADNAARAATLFDSAPPTPTAVFVNDATIPFQHSSGNLSRFLDYCDSAAVVVCNAFESDALGVDDAVSREEQRTLERLKRWADRTAALG